MKISVNENLSVKADYERVWEYFSNPEVLLKCLPGAEFLKYTDENSFEALAKVKVGAISLSMVGILKFEEKDKDIGRIRISGKGREKSGAGNIKTTIEITFLRNNENVDVKIAVDVDLTGRLVQYGRGMFEQIAKQIFSQFAECSRKTLENETNAKNMEEKKLKISSMKT